MTYHSQSFTQSACPIVFDVNLGGTDLLEKVGADKDAVSFNNASTIHRVYLEPPLGERLFAAVAAAKRWTSQVAMRLPEQVRQRVFTQLDRLHDEDEWHEGGQPVQLQSYQTFVRAILAGAIDGLPSLALTPRGTLTGIWHEGGGRLLIEFLADDRVRYLVTKPVDGAPERGAGDTATARLRAVLAPFGPEEWFRAA